jgi:hypothetical protein
MIAISLPLFDHFQLLIYPKSIAIAINQPFFHILDTPDGFPKATKERARMS